jgi:stearoyl-CoA desaturase (delta-9 desaturase)
VTRIGVDQGVTEAPTTEPFDPKLDRVNLATSLPFISFHLLSVLVVFTGFEWKWALIALASYYVRMFGVTAGYHRYFSHRSFKTNRVFQFMLAWLAQMSAQKGALWWAAHHRHHHKDSDGLTDIHSPVRRGFWWSHIGWVLSRRYEKTNYDVIKDFARFPELVWLNEHYLVPPLSALALAVIFGGLPGLVWGAVIPTVLLWHGTFTINSLSHVFGSRRYLTTDTSRNNFLLALITCGEGWHNNHHFHMNTANQGWFWWQIDLTYYVLKVLSWFGVVSDLKTPKREIKYAFESYTDAQRAELKAQSSIGFSGWAEKPVGGGKYATPTPEPMLALRAPMPAPAKS